MRKTLVFTFLVMALASQASDPTEAKSQFARDFLPVWQTSTDIAIQVAEAMPEELYNYKPNDSSMTFREQVIHMAFTTLYLSKVFVANENPEYKEPDMSASSKEEVVEYLKGNIEKATALISEMTEEASQEEVKVFSGKMMKRYIAVMFVQDHLANHRAKANLYIRINNIKPPEYGFF
ncbi:MAG: DinB family protein [Marinoscillum sp.]